MGFRDLVGVESNDQSDIAFVSNGPLNPKRRLLSPVVGLNELCVSLEVVAHLAHTVVAIVDSAVCVVVLEEGV